ncbi:site-2 protease family protein [bacterium]|jgi:stage IV sporulation protein FB|nr:site-2 protease family protein [bacterium]
MLLAEPPKTGADVEFSIGDIPVRIHPLFWIFTLMPMLDNRAFDSLLAGCWLLVVLISVLVHELGHAVTARYFGARPWITLYAFGGLAAYRPQDLDPRFDPTARSLLISFAGPAAGFLLAALTSGVLLLAGFQVHLTGITVEIDERLNDIHPYLYFFLRQLLFVNIIWGLLNLLPIYPLDGGQMLQAILVRTMGSAGMVQTFLSGILLGGAVAFYGAFSMRNSFLAILFGYIAFQNYQLYEAFRHRRW